MAHLQNMTITVDEDVARWARVKAAMEKSSVSRLVGEMLKERMLKEEGYESAMKRYLAMKPSVISRGPYSKRDALYERSRSR
jgi:hypothetical protein